MRQVITCPDPDLLTRSIDSKILSRLKCTQQSPQLNMYQLAKIILGIIVSSGLITAATADILSSSWSEITQQARGGTVNWYMWGGSDRINNYVSERLGDAAELQYGVTINRVGINDTADAVNTVLSESEAGITDAGSVDLIWINGENFRTLRQADLVLCGYLDKLPNNRYINWDDPAIAFDFGTPVDGCEVPWNRTQFAFGYDTARTDKPPQTIAQLLDWVKANPGKFTYPAPPDYTGSAFVRHVFYYAAGGHEKLLGPFNQTVFDEVAAKTWKILNDLKQYQWRQGQTYPRDIKAMEQLFANREIDLHFNYSAAGFGTLVQEGTFPETTRSYGFSDGTIGNTNYVAIPKNAANKAAALVVANLIISQEAQLDKANPNIWGQNSILDFERLDYAIQLVFEAIPRHPAVVAAEELAKNSLPELQAAWVTAIEQGWQANVGN